MRKVSIVVPTYNSPKDALLRLVDSIDAQTLPSDEFEVVFVDDGSTDDTYAFLEVVAAGRDNVRLERIDNSGWPSRPRNIGIDLAEGEYVLFMDHDDHLYPDALRAGYDFAKEHDADVLNGKEAYTYTAFWALSTYTGDLAQSLGRPEGHPLLPLNPHKLYRRDFLRDHAIRFPEGRKVLWEDQVFNVSVARHAQRIATLSSVPFYHWVYTKGSGSTLFVKATDDYWMWFRSLLQHTVTELDGEDLAGQRDQLMHHQYTARVLGVFDRSFLRRPDEERVFLFDHCAAIREDFGLARFDDRLSASQRMRAWCLASGDAALMSRICEADPELPGEADLDTLTWKDGVLHVTATARWADADGNVLRLERHDPASGGESGGEPGGRVRRWLPADLAAVVPEHLRDMTAEIEHAAIDGSVRSRTSRIVWLQPSEHRVEIDGAADDATLSASLTMTIDPASAAMGGALDSTYWDLFVQCHLGGWLTHKPLRSTAPASVSLTGGRLHLVYPNDGGAATLIPDGQVEAVRRLAPVAARRLAPGRYELELAGVHDGRGQIATRVGLSPDDGAKPAFDDADATIRVEDGRAYLRFTAPQGRVAVRVGDRAPGGPSGWVVDLGDAGSAVLSLTPNAAAPDAQTRVLLLTQRDSDHVGDQLVEATLLSLVTAALSNLGVPRNEVSVTSRSMGVVPQKYVRTGDEALLSEARRLISSADVVVVGGAPVFSDAFYRRTVALLEIARDLDVPVLFSGIPGTSFTAGSARATALRKALTGSTVRQITTREGLGALQKYADGSGIPLAHVSDPVVFADAVCGPAPARPAKRGKEEPPKRIALVAARGALFAENGLAFSEADQRVLWREVIALLTQRGYDYRLLTTGHVGDEAFLDAFIRAEGIPLGKAAVAVNTPEELVGELRSADGVIAFRLHAAAASYAYAVPAVGLSWDTTIPHFYESIGYPHRALAPARWRAAEVVAALDAAMEDGVAKDETAIKSVYDALVAGLASALGRTTDQTPEPYASAQLRERMAAQPATTPGQYRDKARAKLRRAYEALNAATGRAAAPPPAAPAPVSLWTRATRKAKRLLRRGR